MLVNKPATPKRIALIGLPVLFGESRFNAELIRYAREKGHWKFILRAEASQESFRCLRLVRCDGAIVRVCTPKMRAEARKVGCPIVNVSSFLENPGVPSVLCDQSMIGKICAEHLLERGLRRFAVLQFGKTAFNRMRVEAFCREVVKAGLRDAPVPLTWPLGIEGLSKDQIKELQTTISNIQPPLGLFLSDDECANEILEAIKSMSLRIPRDVAVIAGYGHAKITSKCRPSLTHADQNEEGLARRAAEYLDCLMQGGTAESEILRVLPAEIVAGESTDVHAFDDQMVSDAVELIRKCFAENLNSKVLAERLGMQRRTLERRFSAAVGKSVHQYLFQERTKKAQAFLNASPRLSLSKIAKECGFYDARHMKRAVERGKE